MEPAKPKRQALRIRKLTERATSPTKESRLVAEHDIYALKDGMVPARGQTLVETGIAIGLPEGTYGRLAAHSGMASKMGIAVGGGVIDADYTGEIKVILRNYGKANCLYRASDRIAQLIVEKIANANAMEVDDLKTTKRGSKEFGSSDISPKQSIQANEEKVAIYFLYASQEGNEFFGVTDIGQHARLLKEEELLSSAMVNAALTRTMNDTFLNRIREAGKEDDEWMK